MLCHWTEYKHSFGFRSDSFMHKQDYKRYRRWAETVGGGIVVHKVGHQVDLLHSVGVVCFREAEFLESIERQLVFKESTCM